jgi:hypothetical protein
MCYLQHMRLHIEIEDGTVAAIDDISGPRGRSRFIRQAIETALAHHRQRELIRSARGSISGEGHDWDPDVAGWVRTQRKADARKVG